MTADVETATSTWLGFELSGQNYAVPLVDVREVIRHDPPTPVPGASGDILGIINLRGAIVTVFDGRRRLGLDAAEPGAEPRVMIFHDEHENVGMPIDALHDMLELDARELLPHPLRDAARDDDPVLGVLGHGGRFITLLDAGKLRRPQALDQEASA